MRRSVRRLRKPSALEPGPSEPWITGGDAQSQSHSFSVVSEQVHVLGDGGVFCQHPKLGGGLAHTISMHRRPKSCSCASGLQASVSVLSMTVSVGFNEERAFASRPGVLGSTTASPAANALKTEPPCSGNNADCVRSIAGVEQYRHPCPHKRPTLSAWVASVFFSNSGDRVIVHFRSTILAMISSVGKMDEKRSYPPDALYLRSPGNLILRMLDSISLSRPALDRSSMNQRWNW